MRTRAALTGALASLGILVVAWQFGSAALGTHNPTSTGTASTGTGKSTGSATTTPDSGTGSSTPASGGGSASTSTGVKDGTYTGSSINTRFGTVQVKVTVSSGTIADVTAVHLTDEGGRSVQISNYAAPILREDVLQSQSAKVSNVSGATYTSDAYLTSLQSALDQAGF